MIAGKLESPCRCVRRVETKRPVTVVALLASQNLQDILSVNLVRAVQICVDLAAHLMAGPDVPTPETIAGAFEALHAAGVTDTDIAAKMCAAVGFRNVAVHPYSAINWAIVFAIAQSHLGDFHAFALAIVAAADLPGSLS